jgi:hypothetical protein
VIRRRRFRRGGGAVSVIALCALLAVAVAGQAHVATLNGDMMFDGSLYDDDERTDDARKDPVNVIFMAGGGPVGLDRVQAHLEDDWDGMAHDLVCKSSLRAFWLFYPGVDDDKQDRQLIATNVGCRNQFHIRLWDDKEHSEGSVHTRDEWVLAGVHHEHIVYKFPCCVSHKPDRDWDTVRIQALKEMNEHCSVRRWRFHPGAARTYQGYKNSGYIGRISMRHRSDGCDGA